MLPKIDPLDVPVWGARDIAEILNLRDEQGKPDRAKAYRLLECGKVDADKLTKQRWTSTARRLLKLPR
jgi:hypothetical protein